MTYEAFVACPAFGWGKASAELVIVGALTSCTVGHEPVTWCGGDEDVCWVCGGPGRQVR